MSNDDKLNYEIFSILESNFLLSQPTHKIRILTIDSSSDNAILAATVLCRLESLLQKHASNPSASISDFFDLAAGSGSGGLLSALLFTRGPTGRPLFTAHAALQFLTSHCANKNTMLNKMFSLNDRRLKSVLSNLTLCDAIKPLLISCFDMVSGSPFMFSRSDAVEFHVRDVCKAATSKHVFETSSVDGRTAMKAVGPSAMKAVGGGVGIGNPTAAAITHVLNNKKEFPFADGMEDLFVFSIGGVSKFGTWDGAAEVVDQSVGMAFGEASERNYVRIRGTNADSVMKERYMKIVMFRGSRVEEEMNGDKVEWVAKELVVEAERRKKSNVSVVLIKPAMATPRSSSATTTTTTTVMSDTASL